MTPDEDVRLVGDFNRCSVTTVQHIDHTASQCSALVVFAVIAVRVDGLAIERLLLHSGIFAGFVADEWQSLPVGVRYSRACFVQDRIFTVATIASQQFVE